MCGIFALLNNDFISDAFIQQQFELGKNRGPEYSKLIDLPKMKMGFHRLAINGLNNHSNQPFLFDNIALVCNGEIYNYKILFDMLKITPYTNSDCEIILHLYIRYGIEQTLNLLDGVFSFILLDMRVDDSCILSSYPKLFAARDPYGVRPLYVLSNTKLKSINYDLIGFASELKCLSNFYVEHQYTISQFQPGTYSQYNLYKNENNKMMAWVPFKENVVYFTPVFSPVLYKKYNSVFTQLDTDFKKYGENIRNSLMEAVEKRCNTTERPIACLLSGGLDSSLITALVNHYYSKNSSCKQLETYSIGLADSEDLKYARIVADYLQTKHTEIIVTEKEMIDAIPEVIYNIESYDTTTVRASIGNYLIGKYITNHSEAKVIFNGDGSDELAGGYLYMSKCPDFFEFDKESRRLLKDIHLFDVLRSDKSISSNGLEPRTPFLDKNFVNTYLSIPANVRYLTNLCFCEKYLIRKAFDYDECGHITDKPFLPHEILWRKKEAFSDGVSGQNKSLYQIIQDYIENNVDFENDLDLHLKSIDKEKIYYKLIFSKFYPSCANVLPYYWMPKYINSNDPSARTLHIYNEDKEKAL